MAVFEKQLAEAEAKLVASVDKEFPPLNRSLAAKKLDPLSRLSKEDWQKRQK